MKRNASAFQHASYELRNETRSIMCFAAATKHIWSTARVKGDARSQVLTETGLRHLLVHSLAEAERQPSPYSHRPAVASAPICCEGLPVDVNLREGGGEGLGDFQEKVELEAAQLRSIRDTEASSLLASSRYR